ncbi:Guanine deaminase [bioreactor metagenome]|uniref:Guanine deaminase n=1 Tax=bioreactor metagenome TaxID=1076179 RepID=A0A644ZWB0_9ZZZZ|nr:amidohydrolase family protein [Candidatus Metalachnospira sp.]
MTDFILHGNIIYSENKDTIKIIENGYVVCIQGISKGVFNEIPKEYKKLEIIECGDKLIIPGMTDLHVHAPQYGFRSVGMDCELLEWLNLHAFPEEAKYKDTDYAKKAYSLFVKDMVSNFTTRACIFATLHTEGTLELMALLENSGLKTMVGKVNMDRNSPDYLCEISAEKSLEDTERWIEACKRFKNTKPIITPRFIPSCTDELMIGLGEICKKYDLPVQSHLSENPLEIAWVKELCPESTSYGDAYDRFGLMNNKTIMAHCVHMTEEEIGLMKENGVFAAHCPESNLNIASGISPVARFLKEGINVGIGSDVAGGTTLWLPRAMTLAVQCSKMYWRYLDNSYAPLNLENVFFMATKGGGAFFGKVGSFEDGYEFDAIVLDDASIATTVDFTVKERLERLIYLGNKHNIDKKFVSGVQIM